MMKKIEYTPEIVKLITKEFKVDAVLKVKDLYNISGVEAKNVIDYYLQNKNGINYCVIETSTSEKTNEINNELEGFVRCGHCGTTYTVPGDELTKEDLTYHCNICGKDFNVGFFVYCKECGKYVGLEIVSVTEVITGMAETALNSFFKPWTALGALPRFMDDIPSANGCGKCPFCNTKYMRCPRCNSPVEIKPGTDDNEVLWCPDCGQKMRQP